MLPAEIAAGQPCQRSESFSVLNCRTARAVEPLHTTLMEIETQNLRRGKRADAIVLGRVLQSTVITVFSWPGHNRMICSPMLDLMKADACYFCNCSC